MVLYPFVFLKKMWGYSSSCRNFSALWMQKMFSLILEPAQCLMVRRAPSWVLEHVCQFISNPVHSITLRTLINEPRSDKHLAFLTHITQWGNLCFSVKAAEELGQYLTSVEGDMINLFAHFSCGPCSLYWYFSMELTEPGLLSGQLWTKNSFKCTW